VLSPFHAGCYAKGKASAPLLSAYMTSSATTSKRDARIDVARGIALLMIFIDHIPDNALSLATLQNFGFSDAAEVFVLLAGMSSMLAYGAAFEQKGALEGLRRIVLRTLRIYLFQIGLLLTTLVVVLLWTKHYRMEPTHVAPILNDPVPGLVHGLTLHAVPTYLDILPLYLVLFAAFPLIYVGLRSAPWLTLGVSGVLWLVANLNPDLNLPNWIDGDQWYFNPLAWQFLFAIGAAFALVASVNGGSLPHTSWAQWLCAAYLAFAFFQSAPWSDWHLPDLRPFSFDAPDKTELPILRLLDILALAYLLFSSRWLRAFAGYGIFRPLEACGRHSLEVFAVGCVAALLGRLAFRTFGAGLAAQIAINALGLGAMFVAAAWLEGERLHSKAVRP